MDEVMWRCGILLLTIPVSRHNSKKMIFQRHYHAIPNRNLENDQLQYLKKFEDDIIHTCHENK